MLNSYREIKSLAGIPTMDFWFWLTVRVGILAVLILMPGQIQRMVATSWNRVKPPGVAEMKLPGGNGNPQQPDSGKPSEFSDQELKKLIGNAEGTWSGGAKVGAYNGHVDPGNKAWNLGSFSYQHGASSPEEADRKQIVRLRNFEQNLEQQARQKGVKLDRTTKINGLDLYNQAPAAARDYLTRLKQCQKQGKSGTAAIDCARAQSFIDPRTGRLDAPGLGNRMDWVLQDQQRRRTAMQQADGK